MGAPTSKGGWATRGPRIGIMTSPELAAENARMRRSGASSSRKKTRGKHKSTDSTDYPPSTSSTSPLGDGSYPAMPASVLPGWGAGWGRIDRGMPATADSVRLQDVGKLLK